MNTHIHSKYKSSNQVALEFYLWSTDAIVIASVCNLLKYGIEWLSIYSYSWQAVLFVHVGAFVLSIIFITRGLYFSKIYHNKQYALSQKIQQYRDRLRQQNVDDDLNILQRYDNILAKLNKDSRSNLTNDLSSNSLKAKNLHLFIYCHIMFLFLILDMYISSNTQYILFSVSLLLAAIVTRVDYKSKYNAKVKWYKLVDDSLYLQELDLKLSELEKQNNR